MNFAVASTLVQDATIFYLMNKEDGINKGRVQNLQKQYVRILFQPVSIVLDASAASNGGKWELTYWTQCISSHLPPLDATDASDTIDTGFSFHSIHFDKQRL